MAPFGIVCETNLDLLLSPDDPFWVWDQGWVRVRPF